MPDSRKSRASPLACVGLMLLVSASLPGAAPLRPPVVEYSIEVALDPGQKTLSGKERLVWRNPSDDFVTELRFHLYLNAFKNTRSTFMRESGGQPELDLGLKEPDDWGWIDVTSLKLTDGRELRPRARFVQPDGNESDDETVLAVRLPSPVPPRGSVTLDIAFQARLPRIVARTGFVRDYFLVAQWFPKLGVYEPAGMRERKAGGWNCHAFHANSEFYADFGNYDVTFTIPARFIVGATGRKVSESRKRDQTTYRYIQQNVHDFAWTAYPHFRVTEFPFDPRRDIPPGWRARAVKELDLREEELALPPVSVRLLLQPGHERARERYIRSIREAIAFFGLWLGAYPYETLTVVDPPDDGLASGGMEYPTFFTGGAPTFLLRWPFQKVRLTEGTTIHEFGHQYWYGMVGSNEFEESWLDEGLTNDAEHRAMALAYGPSDYAELPGGIGLDGASLSHDAFASSPNLDPIRRPAWRFSGGGSYGVNSYAKVGLFLEQLRSDLGVETVSRALRSYFQEWSFRHPATSDFFRVLERVSGRDLSDYRRNLVEGTARLDWQVVSARSERVEPPSGVFDRATGRVTLEEGRAVRPAASKEKVVNKRLYATSVLFANPGEWRHGAKARLVFENGATLDRELSGDARWVRLRVPGGPSLAYAVVDPERRNAWDRNRLNDSKVVGSGTGAARTVSRRAAVKYFGWVSYLVGLWTQLLWAIA